MKGKITLLVGGAVGYVLGARAGRQRYEQIKSQAQSIWKSPKVQDEGQPQAQDFAKDKAPIVKEKAAEAAATRPPRQGRRRRRQGQGLRRLAGHRPGVPDVGHHRHRSDLRRPGRARRHAWSAAPVGRPGRSVPASARQARDAGAGAGLVALVDADQHGGPGLELAGDPQPPGVDAVARGHRAGELDRDRLGLGVVAADQHVLVVEVLRVAPQRDRGHVVEGADQPAPTAPARRPSRRRCRPGRRGRRGPACRSRAGSRRRSRSCPRAGRPATRPARRARRTAPPARPRRHPRPRRRWSAPLTEPRRGRGRRSRAAASVARSADREPSTTRWPCRAQR